MTRDQLAPAEKQDGSLAPDFFTTRGWGYGVAVNTVVDAYGWPAGTYGWDGGLGTSWRTDPASGAIAIVMTQAMTYPDFWPVYRDVWTAAAAATRG
jgi:CubicO group peptidase (beta-lactamase class C family)